MYVRLRSEVQQVAMSATESLDLLAAVAEEHLTKRR
jgi:hypothetical protein